MDFGNTVTLYVMHKFILEMKVDMKGIFEAFAKFFERPTREGLRELLQTNYGEQDNLDFKRQWPSMPKIAKHILGFANSGGGCIVLGVEQENDVLDAIGLKSLVDKAEVEKGVNRYIPTDVKFNVLDFSYTSSEYEKIVGKKFQVVMIEYKPQLIPFISKGEGDGLKKDIIYVRRGTNTIPATYEDVQRLLNTRIETGYSSKSELDLEQHLAQLKILYANVNRFKYYGGINVMLQTAGGLMLRGEAKPNEAYPEEDFEGFITRMIEVKKKRIEKVLNLK